MDDILKALTTEPQTIGEIAARMGLTSGRGLAPTLARLVSAGKAKRLEGKSGTVQGRRGLHQVSGPPRYALA